jgi:hypothetical protein
VGQVAGLVDHQHRVVVAERADDVVTSPLAGRCTDRNV